MTILSDQDIVKQQGMATKTLYPHSQTTHSLQLVKDEIAIEKIDFFHPHN